MNARPSPTNPEKTVHRKPARTYFSRVRIALAALLLAAAAPAAAQTIDPDEINANACSIIQIYAQMGNIGDPDKRELIDKLVPHCNKSPERCADAVKWLGYSKQPYPVLTCK